MRGPHLPWRRQVHHGFFGRVAPGNLPLDVALRASRGCGRRARALPGKSLDTTRHAMPRPASRRMISWISNLAPTSTPLVGSSSSSTRGDVASHFATHDLLLVAAAQRVGRHFDARGFDPPRVAPAPAPRAARCPARTSMSPFTVAIRQHEIVANDQVEEQTLPLAFFRNERDAGARRRDRRRRIDRLAVDHARSRPSRRYRPKIVSSSSERPDPTRPNRPTISPASTRSETLRKHGRRRERRRPTAPVAAPACLRRAATAARGGSSRPTIARTMSFGVTAPPIERVDVAAVAQHRDAIAQPEHLGQAVRHVEQRRRRAP